MAEQRILIECTQTFFHGGGSGIQRVVRNIANQAIGYEHPKCQVIPVFWGGFGFYALRNKMGTEKHLLIRIRDWLRRRREGKPGRLLSLAIRILKLPLKLLRPFRPWRGPFDWMVRKIQTLVLGLGYLPARILFGPVLQLRPGDSVLLIDSTWGLPDMLESLFKAQREQGVQIAPMLHDLFPLTLPETCEEITVDFYTRWFHAVVPHADFFITNSQATGRSLERYLTKHPEIRRLPVKHGSFRLGAELDLLDKGPKNPEELQSLWDTPGKAILAVGTIEPRKNHPFLLDVFDLLLARGVNVSLIVIGRVGWKSRSVMERIENHPALHTRLLHFSKASDRVVAEAIERADCLVCSSIAEGFGLPVVEGLMRGLPVFASDIEAFREIGENHCHFFSLTDPSDLAAQLENWFSNLDRMPQNQKSVEFQWPDWRESTEELVTTARRLIRSLRQKETKDGANRLAIHPKMDNP